MYNKVDFDTLKKDKEIRTYISSANGVLDTMNYTEHSFPHAYTVAYTAAEILEALGKNERQIELAKMTGLLHDIGNSVNRELHALTGATLAASLLDKRGMAPDEICQIIAAIGHHDENTGRPVSDISAALILADKADVRRSRVTDTDIETIRHAIHDRVNYAVVGRSLKVIKRDGETVISLNLTIDTDFCPRRDFFKIFMDRMLISGEAAEFLGARFELIINGQTVL